MTTTTKKKAAPTKRAKKTANGDSSRHYITNKVLLPEVKRAKALGYMTNELAEMLILLTDRYGSKVNFAGYSFLEDMKGQAIVNLVRGWDSFDETRFSNPFAYYTQIVHNAFIQYLNYDKNQRDRRDALLVDMGASPSYAYAESMQRDLENQYHVNNDEE